MQDMIKKGLSLGLGLAVVSKEQIEKVVDELVKKGELSAGESKEWMNELIQKGEDQQDEIYTKLKEQVQKILAELNLPSKADMERLENRIAQLENQKHEE
ncbi:MAG TPA: polyhydroxyalkanoate synthesis regulator [Desulfitobacterium dehalogenans]|uniref:Polyhydroxyalkanoate synthesis regulator n=1 Tax=Desulfitobacterium dehalogenans TaxID=36854 RepID=A0A7C7D8D7_9FIRM|nr:polyhydroxyalkanoate synthesis regulator [Desulfitobacterium dehalogenans]